MQVVRLWRVIRHRSGKLLSIMKRVCWGIFFGVNAIAEKVSFFIKKSKERQRFGKSARELILKQYDLEKVCLPRQSGWVVCTENTNFQI